MIYLNQAGTSWPKPPAVRAATSRALEVPVSEWAERFDAGHRRVAGAFGIPDPDRLLLTPGCTTALAVAVSDHPWEPRQRVLTSGFEHHALRRPLALLEQRGIEVRAIPPSAESPLDFDVLREELRRGGVKLVALTAACNVTGELLPIRAAIQLAREYGALALIDGAQVAGWMPIDVVDLGADLFAFAGHKALHAPWGIGGLYVAADVSMLSPAATCELPTAGAAPERESCASMPGYCDVGSVDRAALAGLTAALDWLDAPARADRLERARGFIERIAQGLEAQPGVTLYGAREAARRLPTVAFTLLGREPAEVAEVFAERGVLVAGGLQCAPEAHRSLGTHPSGAVRISAGPSNTSDDVERVLEVVASLRATRRE